jgi:uncharacterized protein (DUF427 family)
MAGHIHIAESDATWVVRARGAVIGETTRARILTEGSYPPVIYIPREDVEMAFLERSDHTTVCPHKGTASYFHLVAKSGTVRNAVWSYESPKDGVEAIAGHLAFYPEHAVVEEV